eukprot:459352_1
MYEFQLIKDPKYENDEKVDYDQPEIILRGRIKEFEIFIKFIHECRKCIQYFRMYNQLTDIDNILIYPSLDVNYNEFNTNKTFIGFGKLFGTDKNHHFYVSSDKLYVFKEDPLSQINKIRLQQDTLVKAKYSWNLQKIDIKQDINGDRTGIKYSIMIIEPYKIITIKCENDKISMAFYLKLYNLWAQIRGNYLVDFKKYIPVIVDERKDDDLPPGSPKSISKPLVFEKSKSLDKARPPQILEILSQIDNQEKEVIIDLPPPVQNNNNNNNNNNDDQFVKMQEMHRRMSNQQDDYKDNKIQIKQNSLPKLNELDIAPGGPDGPGGLPPPAPVDNSYGPPPVPNNIPGSIGIGMPPPPIPNDIKANKNNNDNVKVNGVKVNGVKARIAGINKKKNNNKKFVKPSSPKVKKQNKANKPSSVSDSPLPSLVQSKSYEQNDFGPPGANDISAPINNNINNKSKINKPKANNQKWLCKMCTYSNDMNAQKCTICVAE